MHNISMRKDRTLTKNSQNTLILRSNYTHNERCLLDLKFSIQAHNPKLQNSKINHLSSQITRKGLFTEQGPSTNNPLYCPHKLVKKLW
jgi:hypothetical protein